MMRLTTPAHLLVIAALIICGWCASEEREASIQKKTLQLNSERAHSYLAKAGGHLEDYRRALKQDEDMFMHCWAATQQLLAAIEFNDFRDPVLVQQVIRMAGELLESPEGVVINLDDISEWAVRAAIAHPEHRADIRKEVLAVARYVENGEDPRKVQQLATLLAGKTPLTVPPTRGYTQGDWTLRNPAGPKCHKDVCDGAKEIQLETHALFPSTVSVTRPPITAHDREALSHKAIDKFRVINKKSRSSSDANNRFFAWQPKGAQDVAHRSGDWPELYNSKEYKVLRKAAKLACIEHVMQTGQPQLREELEAMDLVLWAAVYLNGTQHSTHVHEQAACSGVFYSQVHDSAPTPIEFTDPRGIQQVHTHLG